jgi:transcriptional antiterminator NusG
MVMPDNSPTPVDPSTLTAHSSETAPPADTAHTPESETPAASPEPAHEAAPTPIEPTPEPAHAHLVEETTPAGEAVGADENAEQPAQEEAPAAEEEEAPEEEAVEEETAPEPAAAAPPSNKHWYVVKVQSGREESIKEAVERRVKKEGLEEFYGQIIIPTERVTEVVRGKRVVKERKLFPGYLMAEVEYNDRILYLFRETSGVGDFVGGGLNRAPTPMTPREVERMLGPMADKGEGREVAPKIKVGVGDRVKVRDGTFAGMEGEVKEVNEVKHQVRVELTIFGRPVSVEMEPWQVEQV